MSINRLRIENFKCFDKADLELKRLNVLTGANSAGKSTIIQAILYFIQSIGKSESDILNGRYISLGKASDVKNCYTRGDVSVVADYSSSLSDSNEPIMYLTTDRIGPRPDFKQNEDNASKIGIHGEYAFSYLSRNRLEQMPEPDFIFDDEVGVNFGNQVDYWLQYLCGYSVTAEEIEGTTTVKVSFQTEDHVKAYRSVDIGTGVTYLATIIIAALSCTKDEVLIIENPELYLHPAAQSKFVEFFVFLAEKGLQIIIETHSDHIINGVRKEVKRGHIDPNEVKILFVQKQDNLSYVTNIVVKNNGAIENPLRGFFDQIDDDLDILIGLADE